MSFIAGRYTATYNSLSLGVTKEGFRLSHEIFKRLITGDYLAETPQDAVYRGAGVQIAYTLLEYNAPAAGLALWPYGSNFLELGVIGRLDVGSSVAKSLVLTALSGTPAASTPATITFPLAILAENFPVELLFAPDLREVPIRQRIYPDVTTPGSEKFGTVT